MHAQRCSTPCEYPGQAITRPERQLIERLLKCVTIMVRRFPGGTPSKDVACWADSVQQNTVVPNSPAFEDLRYGTDPCGLVELAGKAVGASFVGAGLGWSLRYRDYRHLRRGLAAPSMVTTTAITPTAAKGYHHCVPSQ